MNNDFNNNLNGNIDNQDNLNVTNTLENVNTVGIQNDISSQSLNNVVDNSVNVNNTFNAMSNDNINNAFGTYENNNVNSMINEPYMNSNVTEINNGTSSLIAPNPDNQKKKSPVVPIIIVIVVVALIAAGGFLGYKYFIVSNPVKVIDKTFETLASGTELAIKEYNAEMKQLQENKMMNEFYLELNDYSVELITKLDIKNKLMGASIDALANNSDLLNVSAILDEDAIYFNILKNSNNNYAYYTDFSILFDKFENIEELDPIIANFVKYLGESFEETITEDKFVKTNDQINLNGKSVNVTKYNLILDETTINPYLDNYKSKVLNDSALMNYLEKLLEDSLEIYEDNSLDSEKPSAKELVEELIKEMKYDPEYSEPINLALFIKGSDVVKVSLYDEDNSIDLFTNDGIKITYQYDGEEEFDFEYKEDFIKVYVDDGSRVMDFEYNKGNYELSIDDGYDEVFVSGKIKELENGVEMTFNTEIEGTKFKGLLRVKTSYPKDLDISVPNGALDITDSTNMLLLETEFKQTPIYAIIESIIGPMDDEIYNDEYDNNYDYDYGSNTYDDTDIQF